MIGPWGSSRILAESELILLTETSLPIYLALWTVPGLSKRMFSFPSSGVNRGLSLGGKLS